jgi:DNA-binding MarR family transcriptional regulator
LLLLSQAEEQAMRRVDLAQGLGLSPSGVTRLLDGLERDGLVTKGSCSSDARVTYAVLTDDGADRLEQASCSHSSSVRALFEERYTAEELETLAALLGRLPA